MPGPASSPTHAQGVADGKADAKRAAEDKPVIGPCPPYPDFRVMYDRGYSQGFASGGGHRPEADSAEPFQVDTEPISA